MGRSYFNVIVPLEDSMVIQNTCSSAFQHVTTVIPWLPINTQSTFSSFHYSIIIISLLKAFGGRSDYLEVESQPPRTLGIPSRCILFNSWWGLSNLQALGISEQKAISFKYPFHPLPTLTLFSWLGRLSRQNSKMILCRKLYQTEDCYSVVYLCNFIRSLTYISMCMLESCCIQKIMLN